MHEGINPTVAAMVFCLPMSTGPCLKDVLLQARPCLRGGKGLGEKVRIVSFRKDGAEERTSVKYLTGDLQEELVWPQGSDTNRNNLSSSLLQLPVFQLFLFKLPCLRL